MRGRPDDGVQIGFAQGIEHPSDPAPMDRAGAHGAGLSVRIQDEFCFSNVSHLRKTLRTWNMTAERLA
jgi:hypothetical protein